MAGRVRLVNVSGGASEVTAPYAVSIETETVRRADDGIVPVPGRPRPGSGYSRRSTRPRRRIRTDQE